MEESQQIRMEVFIEMFELSFDKTFVGIAEGWSRDRLIREFDIQQERLSKARTEAGRAKAPGCAAILTRIDNEDMIEMIRKLIAAAVSDPGSLSSLDRRLREFAALIDDLEDALKWPQLVEKAAKAKRNCEQVVEQFGKDDHRSQLRALQADYQLAMDLPSSPDMLRRNTDDFDGLAWSILDRVDSIHIEIFEERVRRKSEMSDQAQADQVIAQGRRAIKNNDIDALKAANRQLRALLPRPKEDQDRHVNEGDTITRQVL
jgi:molecular chaperone DnaK